MQGLFPSGFFALDLRYPVSRCIRPLTPPTVDSIAVDAWNADGSFLCCQARAAQFSFLEPWQAWRDRLLQAPPTLLPAQISALIRSLSFLLVLMLGHVVGLCLAALWP